jgi:isopenicillin-N N-acyltransferase-like protein
VNDVALPLVSVSGDPSQRGQEQGEGAREYIHSAVGRYREVLPGVMRMDWQEVLDQALKFLEVAEDSFPLCIEELQGIAQGAAVPFEEIWALNCYEDLLDNREYDRGCTSLAVRDDLTVNGHVLLAHNEDWLSIDKDTLYLVRAAQEEGPDFLGLAYGPLLVNTGFNDRGIGVAIDSVHSTDVRIGVPRIVYARAMLNANDLGEAIRACLHPKRAGGYHFLLAEARGELYSVETSATLHDLQYGEEGWLIHTNHYLSPKLKVMEVPSFHINSHLRLNRARRLLLMQDGEVSIESLQDLLCDHANQPNAICTHDDPASPDHARYQTLASLVMDLNERVMWATSGPPCEGKYVAYTL